MGGVRIPTHEEVERLRERYPEGTRVVLITSFDDPYAKQTAGDRATVELVDDLGQLVCRWDCGSSLSLIPDEDFRKLTEEELKEEQNEQTQDDMNLSM